MHNYLAIVMCINDNKRVIYDKLYFALQAVQKLSVPRALRWFCKANDGQTQIEVTFEKIPFG